MDKSNVENTETPSLSRTQIDAILKEIHSTPEPNDSNRLKYIARDIKEYVQNLGNPGLQMKFTPLSKENERASSEKRDCRPTDVYLNRERDGDKLESVYDDSKSLFEERLSVAEHLARFVLHYKEKSDGKFYTSNVDAVTYLMRKFLEFYSDMPNGAYLREKYALRKEEILPEMQKFNYSYDLNKINLKALDDLVNFIFHKDKQGNKNLQCEIHPVCKYITKKYMGSGSQFIINVSSFIIAPYFEPSAKTIPFPGQIGVDILHTSLKDIEEYCKCKKPNLCGKELSIIRFLIAHELGHIACRWGQTKDERPNTAEREATYFARRLLEERELAYNNNKENDDYKKACKYWENIIRELYAEEENGKDLLDWVFYDTNN